MTVAIATRESLIPEYLLSMTSVAVAVLSLEGNVERANRGFYRWLGLDDSTPSASVEALFIHPAFSSLLRVPESEGTEVFAGTMTVGDPDSVGRSAVGRVHRFEDVLLVIAEPDVERLEELASRVLELNEDLAARQREMAMAVQTLKRQETELKKLGATDALTGLANRRRFEGRIERELRRSRSENVPLTLMCLDLDHFKQINDAYGHPEGDNVLRELAATLRQATRRDDLVARVGGEEFAVLCSGLDGRASIEAAERIRTAVKQMRLPNVPREITISIGVAFGFPNNAHAFYAEADRALYAAKRAGRDRVVSAANDHESQTVSR